MIYIVFQVIEAIDPLLLSILLLGASLILFLALVLFFTSWGDKSQLLKPMIYLLTVVITIFPVYFYIILEYLRSGQNFGVMAPVYWFPLAILTFLLNYIIKIFTYKTIPYMEIRSQKPIEKGITLLKVEDLRTYYPIYKGVFKRHFADVKAVSGVSFELKSGETLGLVGESGCGKTTIARTILGLVKKKSGQIFFEGKPLTHRFTQLQRQKIQQDSSRLASATRASWGHRSL